MPLMDVRLAAVLLSVPDNSGIAVEVDGALNIVTKLRISQRTFDAFDKTAFALGAGKTQLGPTFVLVVLLRGTAWEPAPIFVRLALNPADAEQMAAIRRFGEMEQLPIRAFDPTLVPLGIQTVVLDDEMRRKLVQSVALAEQAADAVPDPEAAAKLPKGVTPFQAASFALAREIEKYLPA